MRDLVVDVSGPDAILVSMVTLAEFEDRYGSWMIDLLDTGWDRADVEGLLADWPDLGMAYVDFLADTALAITRANAFPDQVRSWLRVLCEGVDGAVILMRARDIRMRTVAQQMETRLVARAYGQAAGGDHEVGLLAFLAGLQPDELSAGLTSGRCSREALVALAGLRAAPGGVRP